MHSPGSYRPPSEPQSTPTQKFEKNINHKKRTPGWIFKMFTVDSIFYQISKIRSPKFFQGHLVFEKKNTKNIYSLFLGSKLILELVIVDKNG